MTARRLGCIVGLALLIGCAHPALARLAPDSTGHHGGEFNSLIVAALAVLVLIPLLAKGGK